MTSRDHWLNRPHTARKGVVYRRHMMVQDGPLWRTFCGTNHTLTTATVEPGQVNCVTCMHKIQSTGA